MFRCSTTIGELLNARTFKLPCSGGGTAAGEPLLDRLLSGYFPVSAVATMSATSASLSWLSPLAAAECLMLTPPHALLLISSFHSVDACDAGKPVMKKCRARSGGWYGAGAASVAACCDWILLATGCSADEDMAHASLASLHTYFDASAPSMSLRAHLLHPHLLTLLHVQSQHSSSETPLTHTAALVAVERHPALHVASMGGAMCAE